MTTQLTDDEIEKHTVLAGTCPHHSKVILVSSLRRLLAADRAKQAAPAQDDEALIGKMTVARHGEHYRWHEFNDMCELLAVVRAHDAAKQASPEQVHIAQGRNRGTFNLIEGSPEQAAQPVAWQERQARRLNLATGEVSEWSGWYECKPRGIAEPLAYTNPDDLIPREWRPLYASPPPPAAPKRCKYGDPLCPCQDGDQCHYEGKNPMTPPAAQAHKETGNDIL